jgi:hypothetical protein
MAKPIQGGEENLLQIRSKIKKKNTENPNYKNKETKLSGIETTPQRRPQEGSDTQCRRRRERKVKGFHPEP